LITIFSTLRQPPQRMPSNICCRPFSICASLAFILLLAAGCGGAERVANQENGERAQAPRHAPGGDPSFAGLAVTSPPADIRTVQLFPTGQEDGLPVIGLNTGQTLTLAFDRLETLGEPLSVFFYHADRQWRRDLMPSEFLGRFLTDEIRTYEPSNATEVQYAHFEYRFPNDVIEFLVSGNYIVRVTELANENAVLFERPFFITEQTAEVDLAVQGGIGSGFDRGAFMQPVVRFAPPAGQTAFIQDYNVCFARNARFDMAQCAREPTLIERATYQFFLPPNVAFGSEGPLYELDLSLLRPGNRIVSVDYRTRPYQVTLDLDYARFGEGFVSELLAGNPLVSTVVRDVGDPGTQGEYVEVIFRYVPQDEQPLAGPVIITGSFNGWQIDPANELAWIPAERRYEGTLLIKQGRYAYRYHTSDPAERERQRRQVSVGQQSLYTAMVYFRDPRLATDRLLGVRNVIGQ
jgi:hypothetical protein